MPELSLFSYEIMGLVGQGGAAPHDLLRMAQRGRILDWASKSRSASSSPSASPSSATSRLAKSRCTRPRTVYTLTDKGLDALREYARTPVTLTPVKSELLMRLLIADIAGEEVTRESVATLRDDIADLRERLAESAAAADALPHRAKYLHLVNGFLERLVTTSTPTSSTRSSASSVDKLRFIAYNYES